MSCQQRKELQVNCRFAAVMQHATLHQSTPAHLPLVVTLMRYNLKHRAWLGHRFYEHIPRECLFNKRQYFGWNITDLSHNTHTIQTHAHHVSFCNHITGSIVKPWLVHPTAPLLSSLKQSKVKLYVSCGPGGVQQLSVRTNNTQTTPDQGDIFSYADSLSVAPPRLAPCPPRDWSGVGTGETHRAILAQSNSSWLPSNSSSWLSIFWIILFSFYHFFYVRKKRNVILFHGVILIWVWTYFDLES